MNKNGHHVPGLIMGGHKIVDFGVDGVVSITCVRVLDDNYSYIIQLHDIRKGVLTMNIGYNSSHPC